MAKVLIRVWHGEKIQRTEIDTGSLEVEADVYIIRTPLPFLVFVCVIQFGKIRRVPY